MCTDEAEQVGIIEGACALLLGQPMYRLCSRQPAALAAVAAALMGSSGHQSPKAVQALSQAFITFAMGFIRPPMLDYCQVRIVLASFPYEASLIFHPCWILPGPRNTPPVGVQMC